MSYSLTSRHSCSTPYHLTISRRISVIPHERLAVRGFYFRLLWESGFSQFTIAWFPAPVSIPFLSMEQVLLAPKDTPDCVHFMQDTAGTVVAGIDLITSILIVVCE
ncbi:hypothetical protein Plhal304r1_c042g0121511 [Plasmopara halstedii]